MNYKEINAQYKKTQLIKKAQEHTLAKIVKEGDNKIFERKVGGLK